MRIWTEEEACRVSFTTRGGKVEDPTVWPWTSAVQSAGADARGPHCERMRARALSSRAGHTESWRNLASPTSWKLFVATPIYGWLGSGSSSRLGTASINTLWHWLTATKHETGSSASNCRIIILAVRGFPLSDHSQGICPTGPMCSGSNTNCADQSQTAR